MYNGARFAMTCKFRFLIIFGLLGSGFGRASPSAAVLDELAQEVRTLLENHCVQCHGPSQQLNGLRLDSREGALEGGYSGTALVLGDAGASTLIQRLTSEDPTARMPLAAPPLHPDQIEVLTRWIDRGAPWPRDATVPGRLGLGFLKDGPTLVVPAHCPDSASDGEGRILGPFARRLVHP